MGEHPNDTGEWCVMPNGSRVEAARRVRNSSLPRARLLHDNLQAGKAGSKLVVVLKEVRLCERR